MTDGNEAPEIYSNWHLVASALLQSIVLPEYTILMSVAAAISLSKTLHDQTPYERIFFE